MRHDNTDTERMLLLITKLVLAPLVVAAATLTQRRWGSAVGGRLVGLPLTAAPLLVLLALADGTRFTDHVAIADQTGDVAASAWCVAYALASRRMRPLLSLAVASATFAACAVVLRQVHTTTLTASVMASVALIAALVCWPRAAATSVGPQEVGNDLILRMLLAAVFTFAVSETAAGVGAQTAGLIGALPLVTVVLTVATHRRQGSEAASRFLHGVMSGSFSVIAFLAVVALALPAVGMLPAFTLALVAALIGQLAGVRRPRRLRSRRPSPPPERRPMMPSSVFAEEC